MTDVSHERLDDLLVSFRRDLRAADRSPRTLKLYGEVIDRFAAWLVARDRPAELGQLTKAAIGAYLSERLDVVTAATAAMDYRALKRFCRWLVAEEYLPADPMTGLEKPKPKEKPVPVLSDDEIARLLRACDGTTFEDRRDQAILRILLDCGVRISEVAGLAVDDVDLRHHDVIRVTGKGGRTRAVPFSPRTGKALDKYLRARRTHKHADTTDALWLGQRGPMTVWGVEERLKVRAAAAGVENLHAHRFRHTFAADWLANGGQERDLMRLAGWTSDAMLQVYGRATADQRAQDAHRRMRRGDRV
jgi:site-specific recombinase XerD